MGHFAIFPKKLYVDSKLRHLLVIFFFFFFFGGGGQKNGLHSLKRFYRRMSFLEMLLTFALTL